MKASTAKRLLILAQVTPFFSFAELLIMHSVWTFPLGFAAIMLLGKVQCSHCGLPGWDKRVMGTRIPVRLSVFDECPRCGQAMLPR
jgi:hypothetical protein